MNDEIFFDTNVLAYAFDGQERVKKKVAVQLVYDAIQKKIVGVISNQILFELFLVLTKKLKKKLTKRQAANLVEGFAVSADWKKINYTHQTISKALKLVDKHNVSLADAVIASTMLENGISKIFTENTRDFEKIPGIKAINPFRK
jgi:predicted nucleic acid-binding protein